MAGKTTRDHDEIREWAEARGGKPGAVRSTERPNDPGILRICFPHAPHHNNEAIEEIGWDAFFEKFDDQGLEMVYQDKTADGKLSDFNKLVYPDPESKEGKALLRKTAAKKKSAGKSASKSAAKSASKSASAKSSSKTAAKQSGSKSAAKKSTAKKSASKSASKSSSSERPARNYPKPDHGHGGHGQVF